MSLTLIARVENIACEVTELAEQPLLHHLLSCPMCDSVKIMIEQVSRTAYCMHGDFQPSSGALALAISLKRLSGRALLMACTIMACTIKIQQWTRFPIWLVAAWC